MKKAALCELLQIDFPIIMAPMFLVSNEEMIIEATKNGITGAIPALNYRSVDELRAGIKRMKEKAQGPIGINLIVNKSNFYYKEQLQVCCEEKIDYFITSLGSPQETIEMAHKHGIKVFCDVTDLKYAKKVESLGADALIAVNSEAGGHAGKISRLDLLRLLKENCFLPIISAGGVGSGQGIAETLAAGADGLSMGSLFIASTEAPVSEAYKDACVEYGAKDIVLTTKLSGTPCTVIKTPYVAEIGTEQNALERFLNRNKRIKKWIKAMTFLKGMKALQKAAFGQTYKNVWCAGPSIEHVHQIRPVKEIIDTLKSEYNQHVAL